MLMTSAVASLVLLLLAEQQVPPSPTFKSGTVLVEVDVVVIDKSGRPVRGLRKEDFEIGEDGRPVGIATFAAVDLPEPPSGVIPAAERSGTAFGANDQPDDGRVMLIVLDDLHASLSAGRMKIVKSIARRAVERLGPADRAGLITLSGRSGGQVDLTSDKSRLAEAIDRFTPQSDFDVPGIAGRSTEGVISGSGRLGELRTIAAMSGLSGAIRALASIPHRRKAVLLVSQGFPVALDDIRDPRIGAAADSIRDFMGNAQLANVAVYTIDPCGLEIDQACTRDSRRYLQRVAELTGGLATTNTNAPEAGVDRMYVESGAYYLLGYYSPSPANDGKQHRITVRTQRRDVEVRARQSYVAPGRAGKPARIPTPADALIGGLLQTRGLTMRVVAIPAPLAGDPSASVIVGIELPSGEATRAGRVDFTVVAIDAGGKTRARLRFTTKFAASAAGAADWTHTGSRIDIAPGRYQIRVAAVGADKTQGSVFTELNVPKFGADLGVGGLSLGAPAVGSSSSEDRLRGVLPLIPLATREIQPGSTIEGQLPIRVSPPVGSSPLTITATLVRADGIEQQLERISPSDAAYAAASGKVYRVRIPTGLSPGSYRLVVETTRDRARLSREVAFRVVAGRGSLPD